jgi:hypothetical protein
MRNHNFFSSNILGIIAKCVGGQLHQIGLRGDQLSYYFHLHYPRIASRLTDRIITFDLLKEAYEKVARQELTDENLRDRFDKYLRYAENHPKWAIRVREELLQIPRESHRKSLRRRN